MKKFIKENYKNLNILFKFQTIIKIFLFFIIIYLGVLIYKEIKPKPILTYKEKEMECLKLGSDFRTKECLRIIKPERRSLEEIFSD